MARQTSQTQEHRFQRAKVQELVAQGFSPVLNVASKEDPACLADFGATNMDICLRDESLGVDLTKEVRNFVHGNAASMPFPDKSYKLLVYGEILEHCKPEAAAQLMREAHRVCADDGRIVMSFPLDNRPSEAQHRPPVHIEFAPGFWSDHVTVWTDEKFDALIASVGFEVVSRIRTSYCLGGIPLSGRGVVLKKVQS